MSLLLDALKKAALEKQRREQTVQDDAVNSGTEKVPEPVAPSVVHAVEDKKAELLEEPLEFDLEAIDDNYRSVIEAEQHAKQILSEAPEQTPEPHTELSLAQPEMEVAEPVAVPQELLIDEALIQKSLDEAKAQADALKQRVPANPTIPNVKKITQHTAPVATTETITATPTQTTEPIAPDVQHITAQPITTNQIAHFNAHSGKDALNQLLSRSSQAAKNARQRMIVIYALLTFTSVTLVGLYYYLLSSGGMTTTSFASNAAVVAVDVAPEDAQTNADEEALAEGTSVTEDMSLTQDTPITDDPDTYASTDDNGGEHSTAIADEKKSAPTKPADATTKTTVVAARPPEKNSNTPTQQSAATKTIRAHSVSLPAEQPPTQAIITRQAAVDDISESIRRGYQAYQAGDFTAAELAYREALAEDPHQRDALLGAAAVAVQLNRQEEALRFYQQRLARAPKDEYAQAGILALTTSSDNNPQFDSELNRLLREFPHAAHLHFLKGSLYAARQQWGAAQLAFFEAWQRDNKNPDYAFNLAVAMDHIQEPKEAIRFYQQALSLSGDRQVGFSMAAVQQRVQELEQQ